MKNNKIPPFVLTIFGTITVFLIFFLTKKEDHLLTVNNQGTYNAIVVGSIIVSMFFVLLVINSFLNKRSKENNGK